MPLNRKQITNIKPSLAKITKGSEEYEILRNISYLLDQPNNSLSWHPSAEEQPFLQEILLRNKKQPYYVLLLNQSLKDIERFCTITLAPTSFCSILAIDTTFNIGRHVTQTTYQNMSIFRKYTLKPPCPVLIHPHQKEVDFPYMSQAVKRGNSRLEDTALIGTYQCQELIHGIIAETNGKTSNLLGKEHVRKNIKKKLENLSFSTKNKVDIKYLWKSISKRKEWSYAAQNCG